MSDIEAIEASSETEAAAALGAVAAAPQRIDPGAIYTIADGHGSVEVVDTDAYGPIPRHTTGARAVTDAASFVSYVNRHKLAGTEIYAHTSASTVVAVIDSHQGAEGYPGWQKHKLTLALEHTKAWIAWASHDLGGGRDKWFNQQSFAEFIEDRALDVIDPDHARVIELATKFEATQKVEFGSAVRLDNGEVQFQYTETIGAKKGTKGDIEFPKELKLGLRPYIGGPIYFVYASLRYRLGADGLRLGYALQRPENILEAAFADIVTEIRDGRTDTKDGAPTVVHQGVGDTPIFFGRP